jgi:hypothetical protein
MTGVGVGVDLASIVISETRQSGPPPSNRELREDGSLELREDGSDELRE